jgi:hypothetical protein
MLQKIGLDLDNTIITYDKLIFKLAKEKYSISKRFVNKEKDFLKKEIIKKKGNKEWTAFQGLVYGKYILRAKLSDNFYNTISKIKSFYDLYIISHKTKWSKIGIKINLRNAAKKFLKKNKIAYCKNSLIKNKNIFFENTEQEKIKKITNLKINYFIDDLIKVLLKLPKRINKINFNLKKRKNFLTINDWQELETIIFRIKYKKIYSVLKSFFNINQFYIRIINEGTNNHTYIIEIKKKKYFLKIFELKNYKNFKKETFFYKKTQKLNLDISNMILINNNYRFIIYNYLEGKKIKNPSNNDVRQCAEFITKLQNANKFNKYSKFNNLSYATDYLSSIDNYKKSLKNRIGDIVKNCDTKYKKKVNIFLFKFNIFLRKTYKFKNYNFKKSEFIFSPSDFTFKNIIKSKKKLYFFDFEYSGFDHPYKLISDFISQPNIELNKIQSKLFVKILEDKINITVKQDLFFKVLFITKLKWILVMLNCYKKNKKNIPENLLLRNKNLQLVNKKLKILELEYKNL